MNDPASETPCWRVPVSGTHLVRGGETKVWVAPVITADTADHARDRTRHLYPNATIGAPVLVHGWGGHGVASRRPS